MRTLSVLASALSAAFVAGPVLAQTTKSILFTGRFPFVSTDAVNDRPGGSATRLEEFDYSFVTPGAGAVARTLFPSTAMQAFLGDGDANGNYTKFHLLKTYFQNLQIGGLFVKAADKASVDWSKVYFTVRDNETALQFEAFTTAGTAVRVLRPGDWVRFLPNGNLEFFVDADQLDVAAGPPTPTGVSTKGAHALLQASNGDLYYVPVQGGHWISGNFGSQVFANDGAICKIDAAAITYDSRGNVQSFAPNSARVILEEVGVGTASNPVSVRSMVLASGGMDRNGIALNVAGVLYGKTCGIDFDPNGGTFTSSYADLTNTHTTEPNLVWASDSGGYAGTIFSTALNGSVAVINGVTCGSTSNGVPANGSWLGVNFDFNNFQPSLMSLVLTDPIAPPAVLDMPNFGALTTTAATWDIDLSSPSQPLAIVLADFGPMAPGGFPPSLPLASFPPIFTPDSFPHVFVNPATAVTLGFLAVNPFGYGTLSQPNPHTGPFTGVTLMLQAVATNGVTLTVTNPVVMQLK